MARRTRGDRQAERGKDPDERPAPGLMGRMRAMLLPKVQLKPGAVPQPPENRRLGEALFPRQNDPPPPPGGSAAAPAEPTLVATTTSAAEPTESSARSDGSLGIGSLH